MRMQIYVPPHLLQLYARLNLFSFSGLGTPPACLGPDGPLLALSGEFAVVSGLYLLLLFLIVHDWRWGRLRVFEEFHCGCAR